MVSDSTSPTKTKDRNLYYNLVNVLNIIHMQMRKELLNVRIGFRKLPTIHTKRNEKIIRKLEIMAGRIRKLSI